MITENPTRRRVVAVTAAALAAGAAFNAIAIARPRAAVASPPPPAPDPDPVIAAIDEHSRLYAALVAAGKNEPPADHPDLPAWEAGNDAAIDAEIAAAHALVDTVPTTAAGLLAYLDYFADMPDFKHRLFVDDVLWTVMAAAQDLLGGEVA